MHETPSRQYRRDPYRALRLQQVFTGLPNAAVAEVARRGHWLDLPAGETLGWQSELGAGEHFFVVVQGQISVLTSWLEDATAGSVEAHDHVAWLLPGDLFSDGYHALRDPSESPRIDCTATTSAVLFGLNADFMSHLAIRHPSWVEQLRRRNAELRAQVQRHQDRARHMVQDFFLRHGFSFAETTRVLQLDRCIDCDACETACAALHGAPRLSRHGPRLGQLAFPVACRTCVDARCVAACPFDAMKRDEETGEVLVGESCVGCSGCAQACPNDAIRMIQVPYQASDFKRPMPATDRNGLTNVPGLYLVGEAAGDALIKLAINSGKNAVDHIAEHKLPRTAGSDVQDVIVVGAGPAGLSAALACRERGLRFLVFDKGDFATTIQSFPRHKLVMAEPASIPLYGSLWLRDTSKEQLIEKWDEIIRSTGLPIRGHEEVTSVTPTEHGLLEVRTAKGRYLGQRVVLATGNRGTPRRLGVVGEAEPRVQYQLTDPAACAGRRVLVVGGGDSAVEAAMSLADEEGTQVWLSYRQDRFGRIKPRNRSRLEEYESEHRVTVLLSSKVKAIEPTAVVLSTAAGEQRIDNDQVFALLGAEAPTPFFEAAGIRIVQPDTPEMAELAVGRGLRHVASKCDHCQGQTHQACLAACPTGAMQEVKPTEVFVLEDAAEDRVTFNEAPFILGLDEYRATRHGLRASWLGLLCSLLIVGVGLEAFLRRTMPELSALGRWLAWSGQPRAVVFESGSGFGHWLGGLGLGLMALTLLYPLKTRLGRFRAITGHAWMNLHMWVGFTGAALATYHSAFKLDRWAALACYAMWLVVASGILGRFLYGWVHRGIGLAEFEQGVLAAERRQLYHAIDGQEQWAGLFRSLHKGRAPVDGQLLTSLPRMLAGELLGLARRLWWRTFGLRRIPDPALRRRTYRLLVDEARSLQTRRYLEQARRLLALWTWVHLVLTIGMFAVAILHTVFALLYKAH